MKPASRILFTGYAPVHFICFRPLYERLMARGDVEVFVSGGTRTTTGTGYRYDAAEMYRPFNLPPERVLSTDAIGELDFDVMFTSHTRLIRPRSVAMTIQIFHGISYRNKAIRPENMSHDYYFLVGPYMHRRFVAAGFLDKNDRRAVQIGFMKTDRLLNGQLDRKKILARVGFTGERPLLLYAPTGAQQNSLEIMGEEVIERLTGAGHFDLLVKPHDHPKNLDVDWFARLARFEGPHCRITREPDIIPLMFVADLLLSDASSAANEFSLLDRPIVFLDTPELIAQAKESANSMLDLNTWGRKAGSLVKRPEQVVDVVRYSLENKRSRSEIRQAMANDFFYNRGTATHAAMGWLEDNILAARRACSPLAA